MLKHCPRLAKRGEAGGITILVALFMLVLLTISAFAMSKNSLREVVISGTSRQAAEVRNIADTGLEYSIFWMPEDRTGARPAPGVGSGAEALRDLALTIVQDQTLTGRTQSLASTSEMSIDTTPDVTRSYALAVTLMGEIEQQGTQKNAQQVIDSFNPATLPLWSVRSDAQVAYGSGQTFLHSKEAWFTILPRNTQQ